MFKAVKDILVVGSTNSYRSQIAEAYLRHFARHRANIYSAGILEGEMHPNLKLLLAEDDLDISIQSSNQITEYQSFDFDLILTVTSDAEKNCPSFSSNPLKFHYNFPKLKSNHTSEEELLNEMRETRNMIKTYCEKFLKIHLYSNSKSFEGY
jgi:arsenate reductase